MERLVSSIPRNTTYVNNWDTTFNIFNNKIFSFAENSYE